MVLMTGSGSVFAVEKTAAELWASVMISCAHVNSAFGLNSKVASDAKATQEKSSFYLWAAEQATTRQYVETESPILKQVAERSVIRIVSEAKSVVEVDQKWKALKSGCDGALELSPAQ
jgi:hypothetical protein